MTEVNNLFDSLSKVAQQLNEESDSINITLQAFEEKLNGLNLGLEVWLFQLPLESTETKRKSLDDTYGEAYLGYSKLPASNKWGLATRWFEVKERVESGAEYGLPDQAYRERFNPTTMASLLEASRDLRLAALDQLPHLLKELEMEARKIVDSIERAKEALEK